MTRNVRRIHVPGEVLARLFEVPPDATVRYSAFDPVSKMTVLFVESEEFDAVEEFDIPPEMPMRVQVNQWTSETRVISDTHVIVSIFRAGESVTVEFHGETAGQQAEIYHIAQRQRAGLL